MLIFDRGVGLPGGQVDGAHEKRDFVVGIEAVPETIRKGGGGLIAQLYGPGFSLKGGERVAVGRLFLFILLIRLRRLRSGMVRDAFCLWCPGSAYVVGSFSAGIVPAGRSVR